MGAHDLMTRLRAEAERRGLVPEKQPQDQREAAEPTTKAPEREQQAARTGEATGSRQFQQAVQGLQSGRTRARLRRRSSTPRAILPASTAMPRKGASRLPTTSRPGP